MAAALSATLPNLRVLTVGGVLPSREDSSALMERMFGLSDPLKVDFLPVLPLKREIEFDNSYRPPRWMYGLIAGYAWYRGATLVFTRKVETALVAIKLGLETILECHESWDNRQMSEADLRLLAQPQLRALVTITPPLANSFARQGMDPRRILVVPDGVDLQQYTGLPNQQEARDVLKIPLDRFVCVYTGHMYADRGIDLILKVARRMVDVEFVLVGGWDEHRDKYQKMSAELELNNVRFEGLRPHSEVPLYQHAADLLLMPYSSALATADCCSPLKMFEYMAAEKVIVASDLPILRDVLSSGHNCLMHQPDSVAGLEARIKEVRDHPDGLSRLASQARLDCEEFSWEKRANCILKFAFPSVF